MTREQAIVTTLNITRMGQRVYFQVPLPKDTARIVGFEYGFMLHQAELIISAPFPGDPVPTANGLYPFWKFSPNKVIGQLTLIVAGYENIFYQEDLKEDHNIKVGEGIDLVSWQPAPWTHGRKRSEVGISVKSDTSLIEGVFIDS